MIVFVSAIVAATTVDTNIESSVVKGKLLLLFSLIFAMKQVLLFYQFRSFSVGYFYWRLFSVQREPRTKTKTKFKGTNEK